MKKKMLSILFTFLLLFGISSNATAAPSITGVSGAFNNGETAVISGNSFGSHADYDTSDANKLCYAWHNFESGTAFRDAIVNGDGFAPDCTDTDCHRDWLLMNSGNKTNSIYWAKRIDLHDSFACNMDGLKKPLRSAVTYGNTAFVSFWFRVPPGASSGKFYRQWSNGGNSSMFWLATGGSDFYLRGSDDSDIQWTSANTLSTSKWQRIDILSIGSNVKVYIVGQNGNNPQWSRTWSTSPNGTFQAVIGSGKDYTADTSNNYYGYDDIYIDFTQARVEICDTASWTARTLCEIQIPQTWTASSIGIKVNTGTFATGSTAYLYVVDSNGLVNAQGYPLTIGIGGAPAPPTTQISPPSGLKIVQQ